jgi:uncharacterized protein (DUF1778 family)
MTRYLIRATTPQEFQHAKDLLEGQVRVFVTSERRLFLSAADVPESLQNALRAAGARVTEERPVYEPG